MTDKASSNTTPSISIDGRPEALKRSVGACEACRKLKTQCSFASAGALSCDRCIISKRHCVIAVRKKRHREHPGVSKIERKIQVLVTALDGFKSAQLHANEGSGGANDENCAGPVQSDLPPSQRVTHHGASQTRENTRQEDVFRHGMLRQSSYTQAPSSSASPPHVGQGKWPEVVRRGHITPAMAYLGFDYFLSQMLPQFPILAVPKNVTAAAVQETQPTLFLAILNAASGLFPTAVQIQINMELLETFARLVLVVGVKSIELVQALQVGTVWYYAPPQYKDLKYYQYIHCASVMAIDLGINRKTSTRLQPKTGLAERPSSHNQDTSTTASNSLEARRAWLVCYFTSAQTAQNLRRENLIRWTPYLSECLQLLSSSAGLESDIILCQWVHLQRIADDIGNQFSVENPCSARTLDDDDRMFTIRGFQRQLDEHRNKFDVGKPMNLRMSEYFAEIYLLEVVLHAGSPDDDMQPPFTEEKLRKIQLLREQILSATSIKCLADCLRNIYGFLEAFLAISIEQLRYQPVFVFVRLVYVLVVLVRINKYTAAGYPDLGDRVTEDKIHKYMDSVIWRLQEASQGSQCAAAAKFCFVVMYLKTNITRMGQLGLTTTASQASMVSQGSSATIEPEISWHESWDVLQSSTLPGDKTFPQPGAAPFRNGNLEGDEYRNEWAVSNMGLDAGDVASVIEQYAFGFDASSNDVDVFWGRY